MERLHNWAIGVAGVMVAAILTSLVAVRWRAWMAVVIACLALAVLLGLVLRLWLIRPRFRIGEPIIQDVGFTDPDGTSYSGRVARLHAWNAPRTGIEPIESCWLMLRFTDEATGELLQGPHFAKWTWLPYVGTLGETSIARGIQIVGDQSAHRFDIAALFDTGGEVYALPEESKFWGFKTSPLGTGPVLVDITARGLTKGPHVDLAFRYRLTQTDDGSDLDLEALTPSPARRWRP